MAVDWRWAFVVSVVASLALATQPPPDAVREKDGAPGGGWRSLANPRLAFACGIAFLAYLTTVGVTLQGALIAADRFGLSPAWRGVVVATFGAAGLLAGRVVGRQLDGLGPRRFGVLGYALLATASISIGLSPRLPFLVLAFALGGVAGLAARITVNALAVRSTPENRGGAASLMLALGLAWQLRPPPAPDAPAAAASAASFAKMPLNLSFSVNTAGKARVSPDPEPSGNSAGAALALF